MNNPLLAVEAELERIGEAGFDFVDLTLEPPAAWPIDGAAVARRVRELGLGVVGHTAYFLPIASPYPELRREAATLFVAALDAFAELGAEVVNVHPDPHARPPSEAVQRNARALAGLADAAASRGLVLMVENLGRAFATVEELEPLFAADDRLAFHLDVGHAHLRRLPGEPNRTAALLDAFADRLAHVHVHDNLGTDDLHLPLGVGSIEWAEIARALRIRGYDGTVTLEVFAHERAYLDVSRRVWLEAWEAEG